MSSEIKAIARNTDAILEENDKLAKTNKDLLNRIAILESSLKSERTLTAAEKRAREADLRLIKQKDEELQQKVAEIAILQKSKEGLNELKKTLSVLEKQDWSHQHRADRYDGLDDHQEAYLREREIRDYGTTAHAGMKVPVYLQILTDKIKSL